MKVESFAKPLKIQGLIGLACVVVFAYQGMLESAVYGMFIGIMNVVVLSLTFNKANDTSKEDPKMGMLILYMSAVGRFVLLAVLFVLGLSLLGLDALPVVLTFVLMQIGQVFNLVGKRRLTD
ncbi:MAG TPA: ATP synthase subunit I [Thiomicrospira sp.]|nr:ATP synthase subunit I [Thiomicrospira sp.]